MKKNTTNLDFGGLNPSAKTLVLGRSNHNQHSQLHQSDAKFVRRAGITPKLRFYQGDVKISKPTQTKISTDTANVEESANQLEVPVKKKNAWGKDAFSRPQS